jgi:hypothetical protein
LMGSDPMEAVWINELQIVVAPDRRFYAGFCDTRRGCRNRPRTS